MMPSRGVLAEAALATKGMRAEGVGMSADIEAEQAKAESEQFDKMFEIAEKYPQMAVEFARKMGLTEQMPLLERMLQDQEITMAINAKRDELSKLYKDHPDLYGKAMEQEVKNIMNHFGSVRQGAGQPGQTTEVQPASTGGGLATAVPTVPAGVSDYSTPLPAIPPTGSGTVHKNIGYMDFLVEKGIAKDHGQAFQLINQAKGDQVARARLVATIFNGMKEDLLDDRDENAKFAAAQAFMEKLLQASGGTSAAPEEDKFSIFPRDPSQRVVDKIYKTPNGNLIRWLGEGWESIGSQGGLRSAQPRPVPLAKAPEHEPGEQALKPAALPPRTPEPLKAPSQPLPKVQAPWARKAEKDVTEAGKRYIARRTQQDEEKKRRDIEVTAADARALIEDGIERERAIGEALRHANSIGRDVTRIDIEPALGAR